MIDRRWQLFFGDFLQPGLSPRRALLLLQVEAVQFHDLDPGGDEVPVELLLVALLGIDLGHGAQNGVGAEDQVTRVPVHFLAPLLRSTPS